MIIASLWKNATYFEQNRPEKTVLREIPRDYELRISAENRLENADAVTARLLF